MKKSILFFLLFLATKLLLGQWEVKYLNEAFREVSKKKATYKMEISLVNDSTYEYVSALSDKSLVTVYKHHKLNPELVFTTMFRENKSVCYTGWFLNKLKTGEWLYYLSDGSLIKTKTFVLDKEEKMILYYRNGKIKKEVSIKDGNYHGICKFYNPEGELYAEGNYENGILLGKMNEFPTNDSMYQIKLKKFYRDTTKFSQVMPLYPGGESAMMKFINDNTVYSELARSNGIEGTVMVQFTVKADGTVSAVEVISKELLGFGCEREAIEVIESMPNWSPGIQKGKPVNVYYRLPVRFRLQ